MITETMTLQSAYDLVDHLNEQAHSLAWSYWIAAEEEEDDELAEDMKETASMQQSEYFRELLEETVEEEELLGIRYWLEKDGDFQDQFKDYYGHEEFLDYINT